jgi:hypothetical protein
MLVSSSLCKTDDTLEKAAIHHCHLLMCIQYFALAIWTWGNKCQKLGITFLAKKFELLIHMDDLISVILEQV